MSENLKAFIAAFLNFLLGIGMVVGAALSGSNALIEGAIDSFLDAFQFVLTIIGNKRSNLFKSKLILLKAFIMILSPISLIVRSVVNVATGGTFNAIITTITGGVALVVNAIAAKLFHSHDHSDSHAHSTWLHAIEDLRGNFIVIVAASVAIAVAASASFANPIFDLVAVLLLSYYAVKTGIKMYRDGMRTYRMANCTASKEKEITELTQLKKLLLNVYALQQHNKEKHNGEHKHKLKEDEQAVLQTLAKKYSIDIANKDETILNVEEQIYLQTRQAILAYVTKLKKERQPFAAYKKILDELDEKYLQNLYKKENTAVIEELNVTKVFSKKEVEKINLKQQDNGKVSDVIDNKVSTPIKTRLMKMGPEVPQVIGNMTRKLKNQYEAGKNLSLAIKI